MLNVNCLSDLPRSTYTLSRHRGIDARKLDLLDQRTYTCFPPYSGKSDPWNGYFDALQSITGLCLGLFLCLHVSLVSSILFGAAVTQKVFQFLEGYYFFGRPYPVFVTVVTTILLLMLIVHAAVSMGKFPVRPHQWRKLWNHVHIFHHTDTTLWIVQAGTGFLLFFLASIHLYVILTHSAELTPFESAHRLWTGKLLPLDVLLLLVAVPHACIGLYRLAMKWMVGGIRFRITLRRGMLGVCIALLLIGISALCAYVQLGIQQASHPIESHQDSYENHP